MAEAGTKTVTAEFACPVVRPENARSTHQAESRLGKSTIRSISVSKRPAAEEVDYEELFEILRTGRAEQPFSQTEFCYEEVC